LTTFLMHTTFSLQFACADNTDFDANEDDELLLR